MSNRQRISYNFPSLIFLSETLFDECQIILAIGLLRIRVGTSSLKYYRAYHPIEIQTRAWRVISRITPASLAAVVELVAIAPLAQRGFVKQEYIILLAFNGTK
jgi:hypothetical protein